MSNISLTEADILKQIEVAEDSFVLAKSLVKTDLEILKQNEELSETRINELKIYQKKSILQTHQVNKWHKVNSTNSKKLFDKEYSTLQNQYTIELSKSEKLNYNNELEKKETEKLIKRIRFPSFTLSVETIERYGDENLLSKLTEQHYKNREIDFKELFDLDTTKPTTLIFKELLKIEKRLRVERQIKYEFLNYVKQSLISKNQKWIARDTKINKFIDKELKGMIETVHNIKQHDEDLRYDDGLDDDGEDDENVVENAEEYRKIDDDDIKEKDVIDRDNENSMEVDEEDTSVPQDDEMEIE